MTVGKLMVGRTERATRTDAADLTLSQAEVFADISHEIGNFFHRLYYWSGRLQDQEPPQAIGDGTAAMLAHTIGGLEGFLKRAFEYLQPVILSPVRMAAPDVVAGLTTHLRAELPGTPVEEPELGEWAGETTLVDPGHFSTVAQAIARQLAGRAGAASAVSLSRDGAAGRGELAVAVRMRNPGAAVVPQPSALRSLEWALAELIVNQHGGDLRVYASEGGIAAVSLRLPCAES